MSLRETGQPIPVLHELVRGGTPCDTGRRLVETGRLLPAPRPRPREAARPVPVLESRRELCAEDVAVLSQHLHLPRLGQDQL